MSENIVHVSGVCVSYGTTKVLSGVDLEVRAGEMLALVGPNGAGKSTLLGVLAGDVVPAVGTVLWQGRRLSEIELSELARQRAVLLQESPVSFGFTVADVVRMGRSPWRGLAEEDDDEEIVSIAHRDADMTHLAHRKYPTLSGGEKARATFARILAQVPEVLLLDEPTAALDIHHQENLLWQVHQRVQGGATAIMVLHDLTLAATWADRVVLLKDGQVVGTGTPTEVFTSELLSSVYGHPIETLLHPETGALLVLPKRGVRHAVPDLERTL